MQLILPKKFSLIINVHQKGKTSGWNIEVPEQLNFPATTLLEKPGYKTKVESIAYPRSQFEPFFCVYRSRKISREWVLCQHPISQENRIRGCLMVLESKGNQELPSLIYGHSLLPLIYSLIFKYPLPSPSILPEPSSSPPWALIPQIDFC